MCTRLPAVALPPQLNPLEIERSGERTRGPEEGGRTHVDELELPVEELRADGAEGPAGPLERELEHSVIRLPIAEHFAGDVKNRT